MAKSARTIVFEGMELLPEALIPFVEQRLAATFQKHWQAELFGRVRDLRKNADGTIHWDQAALFNTLNICWIDVFKTVLGRSERSLVNELSDVRNKFSHNGNFSYDDAERALDSMRRLMEAIGATPTASTLEKMRNAILRTKFDEQRRVEERRKTPPQLDLDMPHVAGLTPWYEVVIPHDDVTSGSFQLAEFAADLNKVHRGDAATEYGDPVAFYERTYLTGGLSGLLLNAAKRFAGEGGDPVVELQTNFGGGKTHSMLALYHMAGDIHASHLPGLDQFFTRENIKLPEKINRAVFVGSAHSPQNAIRREGDIEIFTLWGEIAWQLGGEKTFSLVAENDRNGIAPGSNLLADLFNRTQPTLILIDEWVVYLRQIYKMSGLPSGSLDANLSFVQSLTEAVKASDKTLLVASLPASQIEVGGEGGQEVLLRLKQTFSRLESSWQPADQQESYEIVRRRLFKPIAGDKYQQRDHTVHQFAKLYNDNKNDFPRGVDEKDYRRKIETAYPIHPELFDQLYTTWGALEKFQRTRGVLRLMAQIIHELWMVREHDKSPLVMPANVMLASSRVGAELMRYLDDNWRAIIASDIDGDQATSRDIDRQVPNLGKASVTRRIARTLFMATAPGKAKDNQGLDDRQINLGTIQPGENAALFSDALRRLTNEAKYLHGEGGRYWYATNPSLNRLATERAERIETVAVDDFLTKELHAFFKKHNVLVFGGLYIASADAAEVPDEAGSVRLVVLGPEHPHRNTTAQPPETSPARLKAQDILTSRSGAARLYRNTLIFLAADEKLLENLRRAIRIFLAWDSILREVEQLDLTKSNQKLAERKRQEARATVENCLRESWCMLLAPSQPDPTADVAWSTIRLNVQQDTIASACKRLESDEHLLTRIGARSLNSRLVPLWQNKSHLSLWDLWDHMNRFLYLPRLTDRQVLVEAVRASVSGMLGGPFAYAEAYDEAKGSYEGLLLHQASNANIVINKESVIVQPQIALKQVQAFNGNGASGASIMTQDNPSAVISSPTNQAPPRGQEKPPLPKHFSGVVSLETERFLSDIARLHDGIIEPLTRASGCQITIKVAIEAEVMHGIDEMLERTLSENAGILKFAERKIS